MTTALLRLLQLASPILPVGAYSYSEGLETLGDQGLMPDGEALGRWVSHELQSGSMRLDGAILVRAYRGEDPGYWNRWLTASRESSELLAQSWQMGRSLLQLFRSLEPEWGLEDLLLEDCHMVVAFGVVARHWEIPLEEALLGYLHSWAANLVGAGIKLIPLGQTAGQKLLMALAGPIAQAIPEIMQIEDENLESWTWGLSMASLNHEVQYSRLFRS
jgi:urease accessory protein